MAIIASIHHLTHYKYDRPVTLAPQIIRLRPAPHGRTRVISHSLKVGPEPHFVNHQQDPYGNWLARFVFPEPVTEFKIEVDLTADMSVYNPFDFFVEDSAEHWPFDYPLDFDEDLSIYLKPIHTGHHFDAFMETIPRDKQQIVDKLVLLNQMVSNKVDYTIRLEPGVQTPDETLEIGSGSCRDSSWLLVQVLRHMGIAARFVSGYLIQLKPDLEALDGPSGTDHDFTDLHAWVEAYVPGAGWIGLDPTSGLLAGESHIPLAATPHYRNAAPISGITATGSCPRSRLFEVAVTALIIWSALSIPVRVGFCPTLSKLTSESGTSSAAAIRKLADEKSAGISSSAARSRDPPPTVAGDGSVTPNSGNIRSV